MAIKRPPILGKAAVQLINKAVDQVFDRAKVRLLGNQAVAKRIAVAFRHEFTLPGLFEAAAREEGYQPDAKLLSQLLEIAGSYVDATRERTKARVVKEVQAFLTDAHYQGIMTDLKTVLGGKLTDVFGEATVSMRRIIDSESQNVKNVGILDGIVRINATAGIDDPKVYFVSVNDENRCDECSRLHCMEDGVTPRVYRLSEVGSGYHINGDDTPKFSGLHPNCRCTMATLMKGYGFVGGRVAYINRDHDELAQQRDFGKSEVLEKGERPTAQLLAAMKRYGWEKGRQGSDHTIYENKLIPGARPVPIQHSHAHRVDKQMQKRYAGQAGLKVNPDYSLSPDESHELAPEYRRLGFLPPLEAPPKVWLAPGLPSVPIESVISSKPSEQMLPHIVFQHHQNLASGRHEKVPPIEVYQSGDEYHVANHDEALHAARGQGFKAVPIKVVGTL